MEEKYVCNMVQMAERALENNSTLDKLVMGVPPRADSVNPAKVTQHAKQVPREA